MGWLISLPPLRVWGWWLQTSLAGVDGTKGYWGGGGGGGGSRPVAGTWVLSCACRNPTPVHLLGKILTPVDAKRQLGATHKLSPGANRKHPVTPTPATLNNTPPPLPAPPSRPRVAHGAGHRQRRGRAALQPPDAPDQAHVLARAAGHKPRGAGVPARPKPGPRQGAGEESGLFSLACVGFLCFAWTQVASGAGWRHAGLAAV